jgi:hypothetical protein
VSSETEDTHRRQYQFVVFAPGFNSGISPRESSSADFLKPVEFTAPDKRKQSQADESEETARIRQGKRVEAVFYRTEAGGEPIRYLAERPAGLPRQVEV